jgi:hypothetical protein
MTDIDVIADSVTVWLNGLALGFTAVRAYKPVTELGELATLHVSVVPRPNGHKETLLTRGGAKKIEDIIDIAFQKKIASDFEIDNYVKTCHAIESAACRLVFSSSTCIKAACDPTFSPDHVEQLRQFFGLVTLTLIEVTTS